MRVFRSIIAAVPQILLLLLVGAWLDLLSGWNHTDSGFSVLIIMFVLSPVATVILLIVESIRYLRQVDRGNRKQSFLMLGLAVFLFLEALAIDIFIVSQARR
jgi:hypothetical protein